ncbi:GntR family transcriptional regulator [Pseudonocardia nematodicida]|uniref:GntR family transcriptional regulator n=1 Tax=Pseudonocardia nematodicida TaxID=1206997 RepID=A0ABV1K6D2_9PSEU
MLSSHEAAAGRIEQRSLVTLVHEEIRREILAGELEPGERLVEERLTERFGVSRPPLREALRLLEGDGLITIRPRRGAVVTTLDEQDVVEVMVLRLGLERMAIEQGVPVRDPRRLVPVREALDVLEADARAGDRASLVQSSYGLHASIVDIAGHRRLSAIYRSVQQQVLLCMSRNLVARDRVQESLLEHAARHRYLVGLIEAGDPQVVLAEMEVHGQQSFMTSVNRPDA